MQLFLILLSGICWSIVYIELVRKGIKDKTYGMPLFALGLNFAWEVIYSFSDAFVDVFPGQRAVTIVWAALDAFIIVTYFYYGKQHFPERARKYFIPFSILAFASCFVIQFAFFFHFTPVVAAKYSAFAQNAAMSVLFLAMLFQRGSARGQSVLMAVCKWLGTLAPTILFGVIYAFDIYVILLGIVCSVFDILYIVMLAKWQEEPLVYA